MQVVLIDKERMYSETLPSTISGKYWIRDLRAGKEGEEILAIEADMEKNAWVINCGKNIQGFREEGQSVDRIRLSPGKTYFVYLGQQEVHEAYLLALEENESFRHFTKYRVQDNSRLTIGRGKNQQIQLNNPMVSGEHLTISFQNHSWAILNAPGKNGTYVNSYKIEDAYALNPGDVVNVLFYKIIIGYDFIAINNPNQTVNIVSDALSPVTTPQNTECRMEALEEKKYFYRSPRFEEAIPRPRIRVDMPPNPERRDDTPILLTIAPAMLMGFASVSTGIISIINTLGTDGNILRALPTMLMSVSMLGGMILFPSIMKKREKRKSEDRERERIDKYLRYLENIREEIGRIKASQEKKRNERQPEILQYAEQENFWDRNLWERTVEQEDFLLLRLGVGNGEMDLDISFPEERFSIEEDSLREEMLKLQREERILMNIPISVSLRTEKVFGIIGDVRDSYQVLNNLLLQLFLLHSYDEVKVVFLHDESDEEAFAYVRKAQHIWDDKGKKRLLAITDNNLRELNVEMGSILNQRIQEHTLGENEILPYYIVISTSRRMSNKCSFVSEILENPDIWGFSLICVYDEIQNLPKECHSFASVGGGRGILFSKGVQTGFVQDIVNSGEAEKYVGRMSNRFLDLQRGKFDLPEMMTFMEMFRVGNTQHLNVIQRWKENDPVKSLRTPIGVDTNGEVFYLDLHEKVHGPHGLVAGMTGSGKSEFLITFILSMAVNYHPDEVAFVLIDYKGGGLTGAFDNEHYRLPHLAGTITNLDGNAIMRSILSIKSELRKRQVIFNRARGVANEGTMDIYKYQKLYREGRVSEPVPHLFIIADEFAELKAQQPEFLEQLISTARIGRSLGVHLILATQKPSGVVSEQIWANSKFKVCLKVQDRADSMDMLKRPDAAELVETGRFYLQVGYNELFELGQSSWCGAPYVEVDDEPEEMNEPIEMIDELGNVVERIKNHSDSSKQNGKQIVRIMEHLVEVAEILNVQERQLWQPELPTSLLLDEVNDRYARTEEDGLCVVIGEVDDPYSQSRFALAVDFIKKGNLLLYGAAGSGKEMFLITLIYSLYSQYSARELNLYILDFGSEILKNFEDAPQTGGVILDGQNEKLSALFTFLQREIKRRKKALSEEGLSIAEYRKNREDTPYIVVIVNNYAQFAESYEQYEERLVVLVREGQKYGIYFALTTTGSSTIRYRMSQNFTNLFVLQLNDKSDYITILGNTGGVYPSAIKGRGIIKDTETYTFQVAQITGQETEYRNVLRDFCKSLQEKSPEIMLSRLRVVPAFLSGQELQNQEWGLKCLPIGVNCENCEPETMNLLQKGVQWVLSENHSDGFCFVKGVLEAVEHSDNLHIYLFDPHSIDKYDGNTKVHVCEDMEEEVVQLFETAVDRNTAFKAEQKISDSEILVVLNGYALIRDTLSEDGRDKLRVLLEKAEPFWNIAFLICDSYRDTNKYSLESWVSAKCGEDGIWIGPGLDNQIRLGVRDRAKYIGSDINCRTGFLVENGDAKKLRIVMEERERRTVEDEE